MKRIHTIWAMLLTLFIVMGAVTSCAPQTEPAAQQTAQQAEESRNSVIDKDGSYTAKEDVALYIHIYGKLPSNYITKADAKALGWQTKGTLGEVAPGKSIGGDRFGNYEEALPAVHGRSYHECDIDYNGGSRNGKRIVYSDDGNIYYTSDHYQTFEHLYGDDR